MSHLETRKAQELLISAEDIRNILSYDPASGLFLWKVDRSYRVKAGYKAGHVTPLGYHAIEIAGRKFMAHRLAWLIVSGKWPAFDIDHLNGDRLDNRIENLREASRSENCSNKLSRCDSKSGVKGVFWNKKLSKWQAQISKNGKQIYLGVFETMDEAKAAYRRAAAELHGPFARPS